MLPQRVKVDDEHEVCLVVLHPAQTKKTGTLLGHEEAQLSIDLVHLEALLMTMMAVDRDGHSQREATTDALFRGRRGSHCVWEPCQPASWSLFEDL